LLLTLLLGKSQIETMANMKRAITTPNTVIVLLLEKVKLGVIVKLFSKQQLKMLAAKLILRKPIKKGV
jgi:hypothetical protein